MQGNINICNMYISLVINEKIKPEINETVCFLLSITELLELDSMFIDGLNKTTWNKSVAQVFRGFLSHICVILWVLLLNCFNYKDFLYKLNAKFVSVVHSKLWLINLGR